MATITNKTMLMVAALVLVGSVSASARPLHGRVAFGPRVRVAAPLFYDPFWPPYSATWLYPYATRPASQVRVQVVPKEAEVYVDGYYAGLVSDVGRLRTTPGGHAITLRLDGYRTVTENIYVRPDSTFKLKENLSRLGPGEMTAPAPFPNPRRRSYAGKDVK